MTGTTSSIANHDTDALGEGLNNLYYTDARADARIAANLIDEDNMASNSATRLPSQQSVKAYVDSQVSSKDALSELSGDTDDVTEGTTNLYHTSARADARIALQVGANLDLTNQDTDDLSEGTNLYYTQARFDSAFTAKSTTNLSEGTNLYFTNERVDDRIGAIMSGSGNISVTYDDANATITVSESLTTTDITEGDNQYYTDARARGAISVSGDLSYNSTTGVISFTNDAGDIEGVTAGAGLTGGGTSGTVTVNVIGGDGITVSADEVTTDDTYIKALFSAGGDLSYSDGVFSFTNDAGDIESVVAGAGLTGGATSGAATLNVGAGTGITVNADDIAVNMSDFDTGDLSEGSNLYHTTERVQDIAGAMFSSNTESGITATYQDADGTIDLAVSLASFNTGDLSEGSNEYFTDARARAAISVSDAGGDGSLAYNSTSGVITYTGPSASEVRAHLSAGTGVSYSGGAFSIGQAVATNSNVEFSDVLVQGSLTVNGSTTTVSSTNTTIEDALIELGTGTTGTPSNDVGLVFERGDSNNAFIGWDESADKFTMGTGTFTGASTGALSITPGTLVADLEGDVTGTVSSLSNHDTADLSEGTNLYYTNARADARVNLQTGSNLDLSNQDTGDLSEGSNLYFTNARARGALSGGTGISYNSSTGAISLTDTGYITGVTAGTGLSGGATSGTATLNVSGLTVSEFAGGSIQTGSESFADSDTALMTAAAVNDRILAFGYTTSVGDITAVTAGTGLSGGGSAGSVTLQLDMSELTDMTSAVVGTEDELILLDNGSDRRKLISEITLSDFNNDAGWTSNVGDITGVTAGTHLSGGGSSGSVTLNVSTGAVADGGTSIPTGNDVYDHVTSRISGLTSNVGDITGVTAGTLLDGGGSSGSVTLNVDLTELPDMTAAVVGTQDELVILDNGVQSRKLVSEITLSDFNNDAGFTTNVGDITNVSAGNGLTGGGSSGSVSIALSDSHVRGLVSGGTGISYNSSTGAISLTDTGYVTGVTAGTGLSGGGTSGTVSLAFDGSELTDMTAAVVGSQDELILLDNGADRRKLISEIALSQFSNDSGWTSNVGDITGVTASTGLTGGGSSGSVSLALAAAGAGAGTYGSTANATKIDSITLDAYGRVTAVATGAVGDIQGVTAGSYLTGGGTAGTVTLNVDATSANTASKVVARDGSGNFSAGVITATATAARYADLAERYSADEDLEPGTVVMFGGDKEIKACDTDGCHAVAGVISTDPAYLMNAEAEGLPVALTGRVPCKVSGPVAKGDLMVSSGVKGHAKADNDARPGRIIGKAIGSSEGGEAVIEVLVNLM